MIQRKQFIKRAFAGLVGLPPDLTANTAGISKTLLPTASQVASVVCEYRRGEENSPWICLRCRHIATDNDMTADGVPATRTCSVQNIERENKLGVFKQLEAKNAERERRAAAARARRRLKAEQLAAIKEVLHTPVAVIMAAAEERKRLEELKAKARKLPNDRTGGWKELSGGDYITVKLQQADMEDSQEQIFGGKRVTPEGVGHRPGMREDDCPQDGTGIARDPWSQGSEAIAIKRPNTPILPGNSFKVKLSDKNERATPAYHCIPFCFVKVLILRYKIRCTKCASRQDDDEAVAEESFTCWQCGAVHDGDEPTYICRLCGKVLEGEDSAAGHMTDVHGDESIPTHDSRFGNVLRRWSRTGARQRKVTA